ncbi:tetratricopeptide repeat protein [Tardiphaga alba]|uniref:Tetratricopeptide repeat protein n=1 Tax=Tardiphaga alba TaxID=340268 RepID=A0ABX8ADR7_9BRAD|nr:caspase family protein [Tardiphaga alba]QUS41909.1 tetratricopeptide repeat protein [Tardiphaga alba]
MHRFQLLLPLLMSWLAITHSSPASAISADAACTQSNDADVKMKACTDLLQGGRRLSAPDRAKYLAYRGWAHTQKQDYHAALADLDMSITLDDRQFGSHGSRAGIHRVLGSLDNALRDIDACIKLAPRFAPARTVRGDILRDKGDTDGALKEYDAALKLDPTELSAYTSRSVTYRIMGRPQDAQAELMRALALDNRVAEIYVAQGQLAESNHDIAKAREAYMRALEQPRTIRFTNKSGSPIIDAARQQKIAAARLAVLNSEQQNVAASPTASGQKLALVIGNGAYNVANALPNPPRDARRIAQELRSIGFDTTEGIDMSSDAMRRAVQDFLAKAPHAKITLIFFAGHGMQIDGKNYLVPVDAQLASGKRVTDDMIDLDFIMAGLDDKLRANVIVLDACRDNPFASTTSVASGAGRSVALRSGLAPQSGLSSGGTLGAGTLIAFATAPGQVALDGEGAGSPFTLALARHVNTPGLELQQMLTRVRSEVVAATKGKQVPWSNSSLLGEVYLTAAP